METRGYKLERETSIFVSGLMMIADEPIKSASETMPSDNPDRAGEVRITVAVFLLYFSPVQILLPKPMGKYPPRAIDCGSLHR